MKCPIFDIVKRLQLTLNFFIMFYSFCDLNPDVLFNAIYTYCKHMNCLGLESEVDIFLQSKAGRKIKFDEQGYIFLHDVA